MRNFKSAKLFTFCLIFLSIFFKEASGVEVEPYVRIRKVIVYPRGAVVKKEVKFKVVAGKNTVKVSYNPAEIADESINISNITTKGIDILDVKVEKSYLKNIAQDKLKELNKRLEDIEEAIKKKEDELEAIKASIELIKKATPFSRNQKTSEQEVENFAKYIEKGLKERLERGSRVERELKKLNEEKKAIESEISQLKKSERQSKIITVVLKSDTSKEVGLEISYMVQTAGWKPRYELKVDTSAKGFRLTSLAEITQNTQEDWKDITLEISTAKPYYGNLPELMPWYLDIYTPPRAIFYKSMTKGLSQEEIAMEEKGLEEDKPEMREETNSFTFILPQRITIPSDGMPHSFGIASTDGEIALKYSAVPKFSPYVYLSGAFKNSLIYPITSGNMNIYIDGRFVNRLTLRKQILPHEEILLSLGVDEAVKVERKILKKFTEYPGIFSKQKRINYEYEIAVTNGKNTEIDLDLRDQFPVSKNEKIKVIREIPREGEAKIGKDGIITWEFKLSPKERKGVKIKFTVEAEKDIEISGLE